ncbi:DUF1285 domain-containing protein [Parashewanella spongiae]|uniref:DUF1285 domain-containing protein n=1 Tax=Parashewanella spongiae TaxID=342950 RepID=A0A3A6TYA9_9GAMM|nr:DUF1285 domain-containing protein [Parashewanella spongiae]MCL1079909.1 DUF1285 domain-containing protein [Parashewanella spongiae]RJY06466.1 DUF1285 domain-containing protein [Parashewanella spongiae]
MNHSNTHKEVETALSSLKFNTKLCSETPLFVINNEGEWFYQGSVLPLKFSRLFSQILQIENSEYFLITPVEKVKVSVSSQPFKITDYQCMEDGGIELISSIESKHFLANFEQFKVNDDSITCIVERNLPASLNRACYYRFIEEYIS